jgi:hypothetical protein
LYTDIDELVNYALQFSIENDIIKSKLWANKMLENGLSGGLSKDLLSEQTILNMVNAQLNRSPEAKFISKTKYKNTIQNRSEFKKLELSNKIRKTKLAMTSEQKAEQKRKEYETKANRSPEQKAEQKRKQSESYLKTFNSKSDDSKREQYTKRAKTMSLKSEEELASIYAKISRPGKLNPMYGKPRPDLIENNKNPIKRQKQIQTRKKLDLERKLRRFKIETEIKFYEKILELSSIHSTYTKSGKINFNTLAKYFPEYNGSTQATTAALRRFYEYYTSTKIISDDDNSSTLI